MNIDNLNIKIFKGYFFDQNIWKATFNYQKVSIISFSEKLFEIPNSIWNVSQSTRLPNTKVKLIRSCSEKWAV